MIFGLPVWLMWAGAAAAGAYVVKKSVDYAVVPQQKPIDVGKIAFIVLNGAEQKKAVTEQVTAMNNARDGILATSAPSEFTSYWVDVLGKSADEVLQGAPSKIENETDKRKKEEARKFENLMADIAGGDSGYGGLIHDIGSVFRWIVDHIGKDDRFDEHWMKDWEADTTQIVERGVPLFMGLKPFGLSQDVIAQQLKDDVLIPQWLYTDAHDILSRYQALTPKEQAIVTSFWIRTLKGRKTLYGRVLIASQATMRDCPMEECQDAIVTEDGEHVRKPCSLPTWVPCGEPFGTQTTWPLSFLYTFVGLLADTSGKDVSAAQSAAFQYELDNWWQKIGTNMYRFSEASLAKAAGLGVNYVAGGSNEDGKEPAWRQLANSMEYTQNPFYTGNFKLCAYLLQIAEHVVAQAPKKSLVIMNFFPK